MPPEPSTPPQAASTFSDKLRVELSLTLGKDAFTVPAGQVKQLDAQLSSHGFTASVSFWSRLEKEDEPLFRAFCQPDLIRVRLAVSGVYDRPSPAPPPLVLQGLVRTRSLVGERHGDLDGAPRHFRHYTLEFADAAQVLWRQHRPIELHTDKKMSELLEAHCVDPIQLTCDWDVLQARQPLLCLALGQEAPATSFYDFVLWYTHAHGGVWTYDGQKDRYRLSRSKPPLGRPASLGGLQVKHVALSLPPVPRHGTRVLNSFAVKPTTTPLAQPQAATGLWQDVLLRTPLATQAEQRATREKQRLHTPSQRLRVSFERFPSAAIHPGAALRLDGGLWPLGMTGARKPLRVRELSLHARALRPEPDDATQEPEAGYHGAMSAVLEPASDTEPDFPPFRPPRYPLFVEGKVHSPGGDAKDRPYFLIEDKKNSLLSWRVDVPLWNKQVSVPAEPGHFPGSFYFPPYKNGRVLLALFFDRAELRRFLDWGDTVRMPQDGQGDGLLLGKNRTSQTALSHDYPQGKPVWKLQRTSGNDTQTLQLAEGSLLLQTTEDKSTPRSTPTYDVSPQVEASKGELKSSVGGAIGQTTAAFQSAMGTVTADIQQASTEAMSALEAASAELSSRVATARSELTGALGKLTEAGEALGGAAARVKALLQGLL